MSICIWNFDDWDDDCVYETECGQTFQLTDGTPADNGFKFCCYCGKTLETALSSSDDCDDEESDGD